MGGPSAGEYFIELAADPNTQIGVDDDGSSPVLPVITNGKENIWTVRKSKDGKYTLLIEEQLHRGLSIRDDGGNLVGSVEPPPSDWAIRGPDDGPYTIEVPSDFFPTRAWTLNKTDPKSPVTLNIFEVPLPNQLWNFTPRFNS